jgi:hypothetical protein
MKKIFRLIGSGFPKKGFMIFIGGDSASFPRKYLFALL